MLSKLNILHRDLEKKLKTQFRFRIKNEKFHDYFVSKIEKKCSILHSLNAQCSACIENARPVLSAVALPQPQKHKRVKNLQPFTKKSHLKAIQKRDFIFHSNHLGQKKTSFLSRRALISLSMSEPVISL